MSAQLPLPIGPVSPLPSPWYCPLWTTASVNRDSRRRLETKTMKEINQVKTFKTVKPIMEISSGLGLRSSSAARNLTFTRFLH